MVRVVANFMLKIQAINEILMYGVGAGSHQTHTAAYKGEQVLIVKVLSQFYFLSNYISSI